MIEIGGKSLLEWHAQRLQEVGVRRAVVITGHEREQIARELPRLAKTYALQMEEIPNPDYMEGSVISFHVSLPSLLKEQQSSLLMDGDVLYPGEILQRLIDSQHASALLIDRLYSTADDDPVLVPILGGRPVEFRKKWVGKSDQVGESVGFFKVAPQDVEVLASETSERASGTGRLDSYDEIVRSLVLAGRFGFEDVSGLPWTEIDFPQDVDYANREVLPAIIARAASSVPIQR
jgi:choline kinase